MHHRVAFPLSFILATMMPLFPTEGLSVNQFAIVTLVHANHNFSRDSGLSLLSSSLCEFNMFCNRTLHLVVFRALPVCPLRLGLMTRETLLALCIKNEAGRMFCFLGQAT